MPWVRVLCFVCWRGQEFEGNRCSCWDCFNARAIKVTLTVCTLQEFLTASIFSTFPCSPPLLLNAYMVFILVEVRKHTDLLRNFLQREAFCVMDSGVLISAIKILLLLSQFRSPLNSKLLCPAHQLCCLSAF